jgi:uncharacterized protein DUF87
MMPRRQTREIPRWRRGKTPAFAPQPQVVLRGRKAVEMMRQMEAQQAAQPGRAPNPAAATNDMLARTGAWRRRRHMPPVAWGVGLAVIGEILHTTHNPVLFGILGGLGAAALLVLCTRHLSGFGRRWFDAAAFLSLGWLPALAAFGFGAPVPALLAVTVVGASGAWMRHYRHRRQEPQPEPEVDGDQATWERLAAKRRWTGTLANRQDIPGGRKYEIRLDGIETHIGQVMSEPRAIAAAWHKPMTEAYIEPHQTGIESRGTLTILRAGSLQEEQEWDGQGISEDGLAVIGRFADSQPSRIRFWVRRDGTRHGLIAGATGAGKSVLLDLIVRQAIGSPVPVVPIILDPQNGQSLPQWRDKVLYAAGVQECIAVLQGVRDGMMQRSRDLAGMTWTDEGGNVTRGLPWFDPDVTGLPVVLIIIDEAPVMFAGDGNAKAGAKAVELAADIAKLGRKTGVSLWPVAQVPSLSELGDQVVRSMLVGGNVVCLRTGDRVSGGMLGLETDPHSLPKYFPDGSPTGGLGYVVGPDNRQAPFRVNPVPARMRRNMPPVPQLDPGFNAAVTAAIDRVTAAIVAGNDTVQSAADSPPADDGPDGRRCIDAVWTVLKREAREMERGEIIEEVGKLATGEWGRDKQFSLRSFTNALGDLASGKHPDRPVIKPRDGVYEALAPRGEAPIADSNDTTER